MQLLTRRKRKEKKKEIPSSLRWSPYLCRSHRKGPQLAHQKLVAWTVHVHARTHSVWWECTRQSEVLFRSQDASPCALTEIVTTPTTITRAYQRAWQTAILSGSLLSDPPGRGFICLARISNAKSQTTHKWKGFRHSELSENQEGWYLRCSDVMVKII